jgi:hypothetical protein
VDSLRELQSRPSAIETDGVVINDVMQQLQGTPLPGLEPLMARALDAGYLYTPADRAILNSAIQLLPTAAHQLLPLAHGAAAIPARVTFTSLVNIIPLGQRIDISETDLIHAPLVPIIDSYDIIQLPGSTRAFRITDNDDMQRRLNAIFSNLTVDIVYQTIFDLHE